MTAIHNLNPSPGQALFHSRSARGMLIRPPGDWPLGHLETPNLVGSWNSQRSWSCANFVPLGKDVGGLRDEKLKNRFTGKTDTYTFSQSFFVITIARNKDHHCDLGPGTCFRFAEVNDFVLSRLHAYDTGPLGARRPEWLSTVMAA